MTKSLKKKKNIVNTFPNVDNIDILIGLYCLEAYCRAPRLQFFENLYHQFPFINTSLVYVFFCKMFTPYLFLTLHPVMEFEAKQIEKFLA